MAATLKKLAFTSRWNTFKGLADKNMKRDMATRIKDNKADKSELKDIADNAKEWKKLYSNFGLRLTPTLKALENAKTEADQSKYCKDGVKTIAMYQRLIKLFNNGNLRKTKHIMDLKGTTMILHGILQRIENDLKKGIHT